MKPRTPKKRTKINHELIYETALTLIEKNGLNALSMRRLATELGVGTMTLYGYAENKDALVAGLVNHALKDTHFHIDIDTATNTYRQQLTALALQLHNLSLSQGAIVEMLILTTFSCPTFNEFRNSLMGLLLKLGLSKSDTVNACMTLTSYILGFALIKKNRINADNATPLPSIDPELYPYMTELEHERHTQMPESAFLFGLNKLLDGLLA